MDFLWNSLIRLVAAFWVVDKGVQTMYLIPYVDFCMEHSMMSQLCRGKC